MMRGEGPAGRVLVSGVPSGVCSAFLASAANDDRDWCRRRRMKRLAISEKPSLNLVGVETAEWVSAVDGAVVSVVVVLVEVEGAIFAGPFEVERVRWRNILATWRLVQGEWMWGQIQGLQAVNRVRLALLLPGACMSTVRSFYARALE